MSCHTPAGQTSRGSEAQVHRGGERADVHREDDGVLLAIPRVGAHPIGLHAQGGDPIRGKLGDQEGTLHDNNSAVEYRSTYPPHPSHPPNDAVQVGVSAAHRSIW